MTAQPHETRAGYLDCKGRAVNTQQLLQRLDTAWRTLKASYAGLSDTQMTQPGVTGDWSVKDILAHVTTWEDEALKHLPHIIAGEKPPRYSVLYGGIDAFNARMEARKRDLSLTEVLRQLDDTHQQLVAFIQTIPDEHVTTETRVRRRIRLDTYSHYPIHANAIGEWRQNQSIE